MVGSPRRSFLSLPLVHFSDGLFRQLRDLGLAARSIRVQGDGNRGAIRKRHRLIEDDRAVSDDAAEGQLLAAHALLLTLVTRGLQRRYRNSLAFSNTQHRPS